MARILAVGTTLCSATLLAFVVQAGPANAAGPYDGTWQLDSPAAGGTVEARGSCQALRLRFEIANNQVSGRFERDTTEGSSVQTAPGNRGEPVTGTISPDGTVNTQWESVHATGKVVSPNQMQLSWNGECGPRSGTATKIK